MTAEEHREEQRKLFQKTDFNRIYRKLHRIRENLREALPGEGGECYFMNEGEILGQVQQLLFAAGKILDHACLMVADAKDVKKFGRAFHGWPWYAIKAQDKWGKL